MDIYNIEMDFSDVLKIAGIFGIVLFLYTFRSGCTDLVYLALKNWKQSAFIFVCLLGGLGAGVYSSGNTPAIGLPSLALPLPADNPGEAQIDGCKDFIAAKAEHRKDYIDPRPSLRDMVVMGAHSYWDTCAQTFGMNYWKHDISVNGQNGGKMLCDTYRQDSYRSGIVDSWCSTVLAPPSPKEEPAKAEKARTRVYTTVKAG